MPEAMERNPSVLSAFVVGLVLCFMLTSWPGAGRTAAQREACFVFMQVPREAVLELPRAESPFLPPRRSFPKSRIVTIDPAQGEGSLRVLTPEFASACSPVISFDAKRIVFSGKKTPKGAWNVWEMDADGANKRCIVECPWDCITPAYLPSIYTLDNLEPRDQVVFAAAPTETINEYGTGSAWSLYTCELNGKNLRRITFNLSADFDPTFLPDGRILYSSWQRYGARHYPTGLVSLLTVMTDGTDVFPFYGNHDFPVLKCKPAVSQSGWIYFVESGGADPFGGGRIAAVHLRRNMKTYTPVLHRGEGLFYSPFPLEGGGLVVSYKKRGGTYGLYEMSSETRQITGKLFDSQDWHDVEAQPILPRPRPKGRSSIVNYDFDTAHIFCLNSYLSDRAEIKALPSGALRRLRIIEGIPLRRSPDSQERVQPFRTDVPGASRYSATPFGPRRILGEVTIAADGSFHVEVPAETPMAFQLLDENNLAVLTHRSWMWGMPKENRGCIGCHEDRELTPPNRLVEALKKAAPNLNVPPERRRTVDFQREIGPLITARCVRCHNSEHGSLDLSEIARPPAEGTSASGPFAKAYETLLSPRKGGTPGLAGRYVEPGSARESPLVWHIFGKCLGKVASPDERPGFRPMPPKVPLSDSERNLFIEWIDLGAQWSNRPRPEDVEKHPLAATAAEREK